jgi:hypothetical protein
LMRNVTMHNKTNSLAYYSILLIRSLLLDIGLIMIHLFQKRDKESRKTDNTTDGQTYKISDGRLVDRQTGRRADLQTGRLADGQIGRRTDWQKV